MSLRCTAKYGTFVPSFDTALSCSTMSPEASNCGGSVLASLSVPAAASPSNSDDGVRNPVSDRKKRSSAQLPVTTDTVRLSGTFSLVRVHDPLGPGVQL